MGFYGNIVNINKTQFNFDRVYSSRYEMDKRIKDDNVYVNRYVLVEYSEEGSEDSFKSCYLSPEGRFYGGYKQNEGVTIQEALNGAVTFPDAWELTVVPKTSTVTNYTEIREGEIIRIPATLFDIDGKITERFNFRDANAGPEGADEIGSLNGSTTLYYVATLYNGKGSFEFVSEDNSEYVRNYTIDIKRYGAGRGYDSTVWQKVYRNGQEEYIMIAELNASTPAFGLQADAPTIVPQIPHFDTDSTNKMYQLHWQPAWGLRVKAAERYLGPVLKENGQEDLSYFQKTYLTTDEASYPSDETTKWFQMALDSNNNVSEKLYYNPGTQTWGINEKDIPAAIFYNKAGFDAANISKVEMEDKINLEPTGYSGHTYKKHDGTTRTGAAVDTQELSIMLPSLGNAISDIWDLIYGNEEINNSLQRNLDIDWDSKDGLRMVSIDPDGNGYSYDVEKIQTLAGCINSVHDLMGMIIVDDRGNEVDLSDIATLDLSKIYYKTINNENGYYYIRPTNLVAKHEEGKIGVITPPIDGQYIFDENKNYYIVAIDNGTNSSLPKEQIDYINSNWKIGQKWNTEIVEYIPGITLAPDIIPINPSEAEYKTYVFNPEKRYYVIDRGTDTSLRLESIWDINNIVVRDGIKLAANIPEVKEFSRYDISDGLVCEISALDESLKEEYQIGDKWIAEDNLAVPGVTLSQDVAIPTDKYTYNLEEDGIYHIINIANDEELYTKEYIDYLNETYGAMFDNKTPWTFGSEYVRGITLGQLDPVTGTYTTVQTSYQTVYSFIEGLKYYVTQIEYTGDYEESVFEQLKELYPLNSEWDTTNITAYKGWTVATQPIEVITRDEYVFEEDTQYQVVGYNTDKLADADTILSPTYPIGTAVTDPVVILGLIVAEEIVSEENRHLYDFADDVYYYIESIDPDKEYDREYYINEKWDTNNIVAVDGLTIVGKQLGYEFAKLEGFANGLNTIHGLILQLNHMLSIDDELTRDLSTVKGSINYLNDIILSFDKLKPRSILTVDQYGKVISCDISTRQKKPLDDNENSAISTAEMVKPENILLNDEDHNVSADIYQQADDVSTMRDQWITLNVNNDREQPLFTAHHNYQSVKNTANKRFINYEWKEINNSNIADLDVWKHWPVPADPDELVKWGDEDRLPGPNDELDTRGELTFKNPIIDKMGHVVGWDTQTVEMPWGFKTSTITRFDLIDDLSMELNQPDGWGSWVKPRYTQEDLNYYTYNKWIQMSAYPETTRERAGIPELRTIVNAVDENDNYILSLDYDYEENDRLVLENEGNEILYRDEIIAAAEQVSAEMLELVNYWINEFDKDVQSNLPLNVAAHIRFAHKLSQVNTTKKEENDLPVLYDFEYDEAGHVIAKRNYEYGFGKVIKTGDNWISVDNDSQTGGVLITHENANSEIKQASIETVLSGNKISIPVIHIDDKGHVSKFTSVESNDLLTELVLSNIVTDDTTSGDIANNDNVNVAFSKAQKQLNTISQDLSQTKENLNTISQDLSQAKENLNAISEITELNLTESSSVAVGDSLLAAIGKLQAQINLLSEEISKLQTNA